VQLARITFPLQFMLRAAEWGWACGVRRFSIDSCAHCPQVLRHPPQSRRDCVLQPGVARHELPWEKGLVTANPNGVAASGEARCAQPRWGWGLVAECTPGSSCLATRGFESESLWDSTVEIRSAGGVDGAGVFVPQRVKDAA
jgi:hypothetical protein